MICSHYFEDGDRSAFSAGKSCAESYENGSFVLRSTLVSCFSSFATLNLPHNFGCSPLTHIAKPKLQSAHTMATPIEESNLAHIGSEEDRNLKKVRLLCCDGLWRFASASDICH